MEESKESLFSELLSSGGEIEGLFQQKKRVGLENTTFATAFRELREILPEQITTYNRRKSIQYQLVLQESEAYSGLLRFHFNNGHERVSENVQVKGSTTALELVPELLRRFLPQLGGVEVPTTHHSYIALMQGEMERELDIDERPLQIALDCSTQGLASPKFVFKTTLVKLINNGSTAHHTEEFTSYVASLASGSTAHSGSSEGGESPRLIKRLSTNLEADSVGSEISLSSEKSSHSLHKSTSSLPSKSKKALSHTLSNHETSLTPTLSPTQALKVQVCASPSSSQKSNRPKSVMSSFITRSLRVRKKSKRTPTPIEETPPPRGKEMEPKTNSFSSLVSPLPVERRFTMSTVMHIYYTNANAAQLYKSVLVSEKATTNDVISQALERYNLKFSDPNNFSLYEVIGKWQDVSHTLPSQQIQLNTRTLGRGTTAPIHTISSPGMRRRMSVEEFVVCYTRELDPMEIPYNAQFYLTSQEGFTRRFDLRLKKSQLQSRSEGEKICKAAETTRNISIASEPLFEIPPDSALCIFGDRKRAGRRNHITQPSLENDDITILHSDTSGEGDMQATEEVKEREREGVRGRVASPEIPISMNPINPPDFSVLHCSSPDSGMGFHKDQSHPDSAKSSINSEQNAAAAAAAATPSSCSCSLYSANLTTAFLLSLRLHSPEREFLVHKLVSNRTQLVSSCSSTLPSSNPSQGSTNVVLYHPEFAYCSDPICCVRRRPTKSDTAERNSCKTTDATLSSEYEYTIEMTDDHPASIWLNGRSVTNSARLCHGDLLAIGSTYLFMFQDYASISDDCIPEYNWRPHHVLSESASDERLNDCATPAIVMLASQEPAGNISSTETLLNCNSGSTGSDVSVVIQDTESNIVTILEPSSLKNGLNSACQEGIETNQNQKDVHSSSQSPPSQVEVAVVEHSPGAKSAVHVHTHTHSLSLDSNPDVFEPDHQSTAKITSTPLKPSTKSASSITEGQRNPTRSIRASSSSSSIPSDRKLMFSFHPNEVDELLSYLITRPDPQLTGCKLAPAYILAMCVEYSLRCDGPLNTGRFVKKIVDHIQEVVWECTRKVTEWQPDSAVAQKPLSLLQELFPLLHPVLFWLANSLEFYQFLTTSIDTLDFPTPSPPKEGNAEEQKVADPLSTLHNVLLYTFQQAFYSISKVLYHSLPVMLESCGEDRLALHGNQNIVIDQAVEFLQAILEMLTDLHVHLEVVAQFYANIFFFINAAMFNGLVDQGGELTLFQHTSGTALRANLNLLEGWACQVGFKDAVLHYLAKFSSTVDLLATPAKELLQLNWSQLCVEFPVLHPAQLHYLLSNYLLPPTSELIPKHWTPSQEDALLALDATAVQESFEGHPGFRLPTDGYVLDLNRPPPEPEKFQFCIETLRRNLKKPKRSVDIVPIVESRPSASIPTLITEIADDHRIPPTRRKESETESTMKSLQFRETLLDSSTDSPFYSRRGIGSNTESQEDLLEDVRNQKNLKEILKYQELSNGSVANIINSYELKGVEEKSILGLGVETNGLSVPVIKERVERVHSTVAPRSYTAPEKLVLHAEELDTGNNSAVHEEWMKIHFPAGSKSVTVPRGDKGFGIIMVEGKDPRTGDSAIFIQRVLTGSTAAKSKVVASGDRILAIDGQILDGAEFLVAEKYMKEAEDDVSLVIAPIPFRTNWPLQHPLPV